MKNFVNFSDKVWKVLIESHQDIWEFHACDVTRNGLCELNIVDSEDIMSFELLRSQVMKLSGWQLCKVDGIIENHDFLEMLADKKFPIVERLRNVDSIFFSDEPDCFHDLCGHVPHLLNEHLSNFLHKLGIFYRESMYDESILYGLSSLYWYTIETGVIKENGEMKTFGAALISSIKECENMIDFSKKGELVKLDMELILAHGFSYEIQNRYYYIESFEDIEEALNFVMLKIIK